MPKVILAHVGPPCDPPIVNGVVFHRMEGQLWLGEADELTAQMLTRIPSFRRYGGKLEVPASAEEAPVLDAAPPSNPTQPPVPPTAEPPADPPLEGEKGEAAEEGSVPETSPPPNPHTAADLARRKKPPRR